MGPLVEVGQVDLPTLVHMLRDLDLHVRGGLDVADGGVVGMGLQEPEGHRDVVVVSLVRDGDGAQDVDHVPVGSVIEYELIRLWDQS